MATVKTVLVKGRDNSQGTYPLAVQLLHRRRKKVFYTGYSIEPSIFDPSSGCVLPNKTYSKNTTLRINQKCKNICKNLNKAIQLLENKGYEYEINDVSRVYETLIGKKGFYTYFQERIQELLASGSEGTAKAYESTLLSMQKHLGKKDFSFARLTPRLIINYQKQLTEKGVSKNTVSFYLHNIKAVYRRGCLELNLTFPSPFSTITIVTEKTVKQALQMEQVRALVTLPLRFGTPACLARDVFLFSIYTRGMSFVDISFLKKSDVSSGVIRYKRHKTGQLLEIGINRQIQNLLDSYSDTVGKYLFPLVSEAEPSYYSYKKAYGQIRYALKKIAIRIGMDSPLRLHTARHYWAMMARENGTPIHIISECLGHTSEKVTRIYLKDLDRSVLDKVNNCIANEIG